MRKGEKKLGDGRRALDNEGQEVGEERQGCGEPDSEQTEELVER